MEKKLFYLGTFEKIFITCLFLLFVAGAIYNYNLYPENSQKILSFFLVIALGTFITYITAKAMSEEGKENIEREEKFQEIWEKKFHGGRVSVEYLVLERMQPEILSRHNNELLSYETQYKLYLENELQNLKSITEKVGNERYLVIMEQTRRKLETITRNQEKIPEELSLDFREHYETYTKESIQRIFNFAKEQAELETNEIMLAALEEDVEFHRKTFCNPDGTIKDVYLKPLPPYSLAGGSDRQATASLPSSDSSTSYTLPGHKEEIDIPIRKRTPLGVYKLLFKVAAVFFAIWIPIVWILVMASPLQKYISDLWSITPLKAHQVAILAVFSLIMIGGTIEYKLLRHIIKRKKISVEIGSFAIATLLGTRKPDWGLLVEGDYPDVAPGILKMIQRSTKQQPLLFTYVSLSRHDENQPDRPATNMLSSLTVIFRIYEAGINKNIEIDEFTVDKLGNRTTVATLITQAVRSAVREVHKAHTADRLMFEMNKERTLGELVTQEFIRLYGSLKIKDWGIEIIRIIVDEFRPLDDNILRGYDNVRAANLEAKKQLMQTRGFRLNAALLKSGKFSAEVHNEKGEVIGTKEVTVDNHGNLNIPDEYIFDYVLLNTERTGIQKFVLRSGQGEGVNPLTEALLVARRNH